MNLLIIAGVISVLIIVTALFLKNKKKKKKPPMKTKVFVNRWRQLQKHCRERDNWPFALIEADDLLDKALKKRRYKGKTMGARLMAAQRQITENDAVWSAHNKAKKIVEAIDAEKEIKLSKAEVIATLKSFQGALVDLGALKTGKTEKVKDE